VIEPAAASGATLIELMMWLRYQSISLLVEAERWTIGFGLGDSFESLLLKLRNENQESERWTQQGSMHDCSRWAALA